MLPVSLITGGVLFFSFDAYISNLLLQHQVQLGSSDQEHVKDILDACAQNGSSVSVLTPGCATMDPASIVGLVDASLDLAIKCASTLKRLNTIASQYKHARLTILSMIQNIDSVQLAWNRISVWLKSYVPDQNAAENGLIERLERFLETGALVIEALDEDLSTYDPDNLSLTDRSRLIWNGQALQDHQNRLGD